MPKAPTTVDELGLRMYCPDGHRIYWPEVVRDPRKRDVDPNFRPPIYETAERGVCSDGRSWDQQRTPTKENKRSWQRREGQPRYEPTGSPPRLEPSEMRGLSGGSGKAQFRITVNGDGGRRVVAEVRCASVRFYLQPNGEYARDADHETLHRIIKTDHIETEDEWLALMNDLRADGWDTMTVMCPGCIDESAAYNAYIESMRQKALALEEEPNVVPAISN